MHYRGSMGDFASLAAILGSLSGWLPPLAALIAMLWYLLQIWESRTVQTWMLDHDQKMRARRLRTLMAKEKLIQAELLSLGLQSEARVMTAQAQTFSTKARVENAQEAERLPNADLVG